MTKLGRGKKALAPQPRGEAFVRPVLDATVAQLAEVGFERLTIPDVASRSKVNKTSIYRRWPTKSELVRDALEQTVDHVERAPDTGDLRADLLALAQTVADFIQTPEGMGVIRLMFAEGGNPEVRALAATSYRKIEKRVPHAALLRALANGELTDASTVSQVLFTLAGAIMHRVFIEQGTPSGPFLERVVDLVLLGATPRATKPAKKVTKKSATPAPPRRRL